MKENMWEQKQNATELIFKLFIPLCFIIILAGAFWDMNIKKVGAQNCVTPPPDGKSCHRPEHVTPQPVATVDTASTTSMLDTECLFRNSIQGGKIMIEIPRLTNVGSIAQARLVIEAWDVDTQTLGDPQLNERDTVTFDGMPIKNTMINEGSLWPNILCEKFNTDQDNLTNSLIGCDNKWEYNIFWVDPKKLEDPNFFGSHKIEIEIDTLNKPKSDWCTAIDWVALVIEAVDMDGFLIVKVEKENFTVSSIFGSANTLAEQDDPWLDPQTGIPSLNMPWRVIYLDPSSTLEENASAIGAMVNELSRLPEVQRITIVADGNTGVAARHYTETDDRVAQLIQIGAPNGGSHLADIVGVLDFYPLPLLSAESRASFRQLVTESMAKTYNPWHVSNPNTRYISAIGTYEPAEAVLDGMLLSRDSANIGNYTTAGSEAIHRVINIESNDKNARHTKLYESVKVYNELVGYITETVTLPAFSAPGFIQAQDNTDLFYTDIMTGVITGTMKSVTHTLYIDSDKPIGFTLLSGQKNLDFALISPKGQRIDPTIADSSTTSAFWADAIGELYFSIYAFTGSQENMGKWKLEISATSATTVTESMTIPYALRSQLIDPPHVLNVETDRLAYAVGESSVITATFFNNGAPINDAKVIAKRLLPETGLASLEVITLTETAPGLYSGIFTDTKEPGLYSVLVTATTQKEPIVSRESLVLIPVSGSTATLAQIGPDYLNDTNGDGFADELVVDIGLNISGIGTYRIVGELVNANGITISTKIAEANLSSGLQVIPLRFNGSYIFQKKFNGPYTLRIIRLGEVRGGAVFPLEEPRAKYIISKASSHRQFQRPKVYFPGSGNDEGVDTDQNGLFNLLRVNLDVDIVAPGDYHWSAWLVDQEGNFIDSTVHNGKLMPTPVVSLTSATQISLTFSGPSIRAHGVDGPYRLSNLRLAQVSTPNHGVHILDPELSYTRHSFRADEFDDFTSSPNEPIIYMSSSSSGVVAGIRFEDEDILAFDPNSNTWAEVFDGSDINITTDLDAFAVLDHGSFLLSFQEIIYIPGLGEVDDSDIISFTSTSQDITEGRFGWYLDGSDVGLTTEGEDIDAIDFTLDGRLVISTKGDIKVDDVAGSDEDLLVFNATSLGENTSGTWELYFDGSDVAHLGEDIWGVWIDDTNGNIYLSLESNLSINGVKDDGTNIFVCASDSLGNNTTCTLTLFWDGAAHGFSNERIDGIDIVKITSRISARNRAYQIFLPTVNR